MIKKLLFIATFVFSGALIAQNLTLENSVGTSIEGKTYYFYDSGFSLSETKFHVSNSSASNINFGIKMYEIANSVPEDWQVCFGTDCRTATKSIAAAQDYKSATVNATASYDSVKIAPFSFSWSGGEWGVWRITIYDTLNTTDSSSAYVYWEAGGKPTGDINSNGVIDGNEVAGDIDEDGAATGNEIVGDVNGNGMIDPWEVGGDSNGNGVIDGNEHPLSVSEISADQIYFSAYPNPTNGVLTINYNIDANSAKNTLEVFDVVGKKVKSYALIGNKGKLELNVNDLNAGVYFYSVNVDGQALKTERIIVK